MCSGVLAAVSLLSVPAWGAAPGFDKHTYTYKKVGDLEIKADVYRPPDASVRPVVFWIHGGALIFGHRENLRTRQLERYIEAGFTVVSIDYRLAPEIKLPLILEDVRDAWRWVRTEGPRLFHADPDRIAVVGHSAGGYLTLAAGYILAPRPRALVAFYGYGDITGDWYSKPDPFYSREPAVSKEEAFGAVGAQALSGASFEEKRFKFYLYCRQKGLWPKEVAGADPVKERARFDPWCPLRNVSRLYPPTLLLHGDADTDVPFAQSEQMAAELEKHKVPHELIRIPGGPHGFDGDPGDARAAAAFDKVISFLRDHLL